ncbi:5-oxoprolinase subunit B family protein [Pseudomonas costantinii]|uniref:Allophanate hydrolase n=1 Tax=Pseudomonas costantinii TaxID=168469 RepID=A0A1S2UR04_9PSED|nr:allophanate hydrolase subunit 1 [Pseudomonas costantinii]NVZ23724.1 allophanate hydrolase subunit 1 [Pseudomonas costantinii]OIN48398.1 allophanate hydrolase [Pseudomonas costantinii]SED53821.1 sensor histidine kinase inhibitor, KipI family [Pseudomonas costantinii]
MSNVNCDVRDSARPVGVTQNWRFEPCGDSCIVVVFATVFSAQANRRAVAFSATLHDRLARGLLSGVTDVIPAMVSVGVHYSPDVFATRHPELLPYDAVSHMLENALIQLQAAPSATPKRLDIPVCYEGDYAPDLLGIANACAMTPGEVIAAHTGQWVDVLMVGFAPGHPYIGMHEPALKLARRSVPRTLVKQGSVGLANRQSVIYPSDLPGGWNIVGRTPLNLFSPANEPPCLLTGGDQVRFVPITAREFEHLAGDRR